MAIRLAHCTIEFPSWGVRTTFEDGTHVDGVPHEQLPRYHVAAHRAGYEDDVLRYSRHHDFAHAFLAERIAGKPSAVLWAQAHGSTPSYAETIMEEIAVQAFQRYLMANERPLVNAPWHEWKAEALELLNGP